MISKRGQMNMSFGWLFAIIVGAAILVLVIYGVSTFIKTNNEQSSVVGAKELGALLNPLETGLESSKTTPLRTKIESRIHNECRWDDFSGPFGQQRISLAEMGFGDEFGEEGLPGISKNKYLFSDEFEEGKLFYVMVKPFEYPYKVSDLMYLTSASENYCFSNAPEEIEEELSGLNQTNIFIGCDSRSDHIEVCFNSGACDINVNTQSKSVEKEGDKMYYYDDSLMYAAIFSEKEIYECQVKRLLKRTRELASIYQEKSLIISTQNCRNDVGTTLESLQSQIGDYLSDENSDSQRLIGINQLVSQIDIRSGGNCPLW